MVNSVQNCYLVDFCSKWNPALKKMGIENVICPCCEHTFGNVPIGTKLIKVESSRDRFDSNDSDQSENLFKNCDTKFFTISTKKIR